MSYSFAIAGDALADLKTLDSWLQEEVLDEIDTLGASSAIFPNLPNAGDTVYAFTRVHSGVKHHIALVLTRNDSSKTFTVLGIVHQIQT